MLKKTKEVAKPNLLQIPKNNPFIGVFTTYEETKQENKQDKFPKKEKKQCAESEEEEDNVEIPSERNCPRSFSLNKSFIPEANEIRSLPNTPGCDGVSKRILEKSTHFTKKTSTFLHESERHEKLDKSCIVKYREPKSLASITDLLCHKASIKETRDSEDTLRMESIPTKIKLDNKK